MSASQPAYFHLQEFSDLGVLLLAGRLYTYAQGTTAHKTAYTDPAGAVPQTYTADGLGGQYIALNARGELPAPLYLAPGSYDIALKRLDGSTVWTRRADPTGDNIAALLTAFLASGGSSLIGFIHSGIGAVMRTVYDKLTDTVNVFDFMTAAQKADVKAGTALIDVTAAWQAAQEAGDRIRVPAGKHLLNNFRFKWGKVFVGEGYYRSRIKQALPGAYAVNALSDATWGTLWGIGLLKVGFEGAAGATVAVLNVEANGAYAIQGAEFDFAADGVYQALRMWCPDAANVYNSKFTAYVNGVTGVAIRSQGAYNTYDFFVTGCGLEAVLDYSSSSTFTKVVTENKQQYNGFDNLIFNAKVESWSGVASDFAAIQINGTGNRLYHSSIVGVPNAKANAAYSFNGNNNYTVEGIWITSVSGNVPTYSITMGAGSSGSMTDVRSDCPQGVDNVVPYSTRKNWQFLGDCRTITSQATPPAVLRYSWNFPASGATIAMLDNTAAVMLEANIAALTIALPPAPDDGQVFRVTSLGAITAITWTPGAGKTVHATVPTTAAAGASFALMYHAQNTRWVPMA